MSRFRTSPARSNGPVSASEAERARIVLSRSKNAADVAKAASFWCQRRAPDLQLRFHSGGSVALSTVTGPSTVAVGTSGNCRGVTTLRAERAPTKTSLGHAVIIDPFDNAELRELAVLTGMPVRSIPKWPFDLGPRDCVISTVPVPQAHAGRVLGVVVGPAPAPGIGEVWPDRVVHLETGAAAVAAHLAGDSDPKGLVVAVVGMSGGIGTSTAAAALARQLAGVPLAVALVNTDPIPHLRSLLALGEGSAWADLAGSGPLLPNRIELPVWERVRVLCADSRGGAGDRLAAATHALRCAHDMVVVDVGRDFGALAALRPSLCVAVMEGEPVAVAATAALLERLGSPCVAVVRAGGSIAAPEVAVRLGVDVVSLGLERGGSGAAHGCRPGDRSRGAVSRAVREIGKYCEELL